MISATYGRLTLMVLERPASALGSYLKRRRKMLKVIAVSSPRLKAVRRVRS